MKNEKEKRKKGKKEKKKKKERMYLKNIYKIRKIYSGFFNSFLH